MERTRHVEGPMGMGRKAPSREKTRVSISTSVAFVHSRRRSNCHLNLHFTGVKHRLRDRHLAMMAVRAICHCLDKDRDAIHLGRWR